VIIIPMAKIIPGRSILRICWNLLSKAGSRVQGRFVEARKRTCSECATSPSSWTKNSALHLFREISLVSFNFNFCFEKKDQVTQWQVESFHLLSIWIFPILSFQILKEKLRTNGKESVGSISPTNFISLMLCRLYRAFHRFGQAKLPYGGSVLGSSQILILPQLPLKMILGLKVVKIDSKIKNSLC